MMRPPPAPAVHKPLIVRPDDRDPSKRARPSLGSDGQPLTKRVRRDGPPAQPPEPSRGANALRLPIVAQEPSRGSLPGSRDQAGQSPPALVSAEHRANNSPTASSSSNPISVVNNASQAVLDALYEEDDWVFSPVPRGQSPPYVEPHSDEAEDAHWAELERLNQISPSTPAGRSTDFSDTHVNPSSPGPIDDEITSPAIVEASSPYVPLQDALHARKRQRSRSSTPSAHVQRAKRSEKSSRRLNGDSDSDTSYDDGLPASSDDSLFSPPTRGTGRPSTSQRPLLRVNTDAKVMASVVDHDFATMSPLTDDGSDFVPHSPASDAPSPLPTPVPSSSKATSATSTSSDRPRPPTALPPKLANHGDAATRLFGKLAQHDEFFDTRVRNIDGDRVQCNGCGRWMQLKSWEKHLKHICPVYLIQPIQPTPARKLLAEKAPMPSPPRKGSGQRKSAAAAASEALDADEIFEQIKTDTRVRSVEGEHVQCDGCGSWLKIINWPAHIDGGKCHGKKRGKKQYWVYVSDEE